jgi:release factor glutamine methyltransferase
LLRDAAPYRDGVTVLEVIQRSTEFLGQKGVESPRLHAEWLLAHVLGLPRLQLYLNFERRLTDDEADRARLLVKRRGQREPLQHLLGTVCFCGLELKVNRHVLVPRPETEGLAELAVQFLKSFDAEHLGTPGEHGTGPIPLTRPTGTLSPSDGEREGARERSMGGRENETPAILDFGTGSGCLAITLAVKCPRARVHAVDLSAEALAVARENAAAHGVADRIAFREGDGLAVLHPALTFDLMVANPPYIPSAEIATLMPEVRDYDPRLALDGGADGLEFYRHLAAGAGARLRAGGRMMLEFGDGQAEALGDLFRQHNWIVERVEADYSHRPRILVVSLPRAWQTTGAT